MVESFTGYVQVYTDRPAKTMKSPLLVVNPVQVVKLDFSLDFCRWLNVNGHTFAWFFLCGKQVVA